MLPFKIMLQCTWGRGRTWWSATRRTASRSPSSPTSTHSPQLPSWLPPSRGKEIWAPMTSKFSIVSIAKYQGCKSQLGWIVFFEPHSVGIFLSNYPLPRPRLFPGWQNSWNAATPLSGRDVMSWAATVGFKQLDMRAGMIQANTCFERVDESHIISPCTTLLSLFLLSHPVTPCLTPWSHKPNVGVPFWSYCWSRMKSFSATLNPKHYVGNALHYSVNSSGN